MTETLDILYSVTGQSLHFDCPEGRPSSVVASQVFEASDGDESTPEAALDGFAAIEADPATTLDDAAAYGARTVPLTATTGIERGRVYRLTNATGESEVVEVVEVASATSVTVRHPLANAYASGDAFESTRIEHALDATWIADKQNVSERNDPNPRYRWRLVYVVDGTTYAHNVFFDLVRYRGAHTVTGLDVDAAFPGWLDMLPTHYREDRGARCISEAYRQVKLDMYQVGKADQMARNTELVDDLVMHKCAALGIQAALYAGATIDPAAVEAARAGYRERHNNLLVGDKLHFDNGGEGAARPTHKAPLFRR